MKTLKFRHPKQTDVSERVIYANLADRSVSCHARLQKLGIDNVKCRHESTNIAVCPVATHNQTDLTTLRIYTINTAVQSHVKTIKVK